MVGIEKESIGRVALLRLNRPATGNRLTLELMEEFSSIIAGVGRDANVGAIVLTARGTAFCAGGDLSGYAARSAMAIRRFGTAFIGLHLAIAGCPKPVIAAVEGRVEGGGCSLVDACDLAVAGEDAAFALPEIASGLAPMMSLAGLGRSMGKKIAAELALTGRTVRAEEALRLGLVNRVVPAGSVVHEALAWAESLAGNSPAAVELFKWLYRGMFERDYEANLERGLDVLISLLKSGAGPE